MKRNALRWAAGELLARQTRTEIVGMGFQVREHALESRTDPFAAFKPDLMWVQLDNLAEDPRGEFIVSSEQLRDVLTNLVHIYGEGNVRPHALWHNHFALAGPSPFDIAYFPEWVSIGVVWHVPTDRIVLYDGEGPIDDPAESLVPPLAVSYGTMH